MKGRKAQQDSMLYRNQNMQQTLDHANPIFTTHILQYNQGAQIQPMRVENR